MNRTTNNVPQVFNGFKIRTANWPWYGLYGVLVKKLQHSLSSVTSNVVIHVHRSMSWGNVVEMRHHDGIKNVSAIFLSG